MRIVVLMMRLIRVDKGSKSEASSSIIRAGILWWMMENIKANRVAFRIVSVAEGMASDIACRASERGMVV